MKKIFILCLALFSFLLSQSQMRYLKGRLEGSQETPQKAVNGSGVVIVQYNMATKTLKLFGDYDSLTTTITGSHIHEGAPAVAGPIIITLANSGGTNGTLLVTATLTQPQEDSLLAGNMYANVHTTMNGGGEIRAQLTPTTDGQTTFLSGRLQGAQETPPNPSTATGSAYALADMATDSIFVTGNYTGLTTPTVAAHVHLELPGTAGSVLFPISHSSSTAGTLHAATIVNAQQASLIASGGSYVNVHSSKYPNGEIRAQLINNATMRYFSGDLSGANEVNVVDTKARGTVIVSYNTETRVLQLAGDYQNLSDTVTGVNLYMGAAGAVGDSILKLTTSRDSSGTITGFATLTANQDTALLAGNMYVNVRDNKFKDGEIRTQLMATASGQTQLFAVKLSGTQEVPAIDTLSSSASGNALVIVDKTTGMLYATGAFTGINSPVFRADIREGAVGDTGAVVLPLNPAKVIRTKSGTFSGSGIIPQSVIDSMISGLTYINVYSTFYRTGAVRGQLGDLVLPLKLTYFNAYKQRNQIELVWETSEELNVSRYEIEQLNTATQQWITKGTVPAKGGSSATTYNFNDVPNFYGSSAYVLYRLKMIDKDGRITYSSLVKVNFEKLKAELTIQANPIVNGELKFNITGLSTEKKAEVSIIDYNGRLMLRNTVSTMMNNTLQIHKLAAGMYKLIVRIDDTVLQKGFIK